MVSLTSQALERGGDEGFTNRTFANSIPMGDQANENHVCLSPSIERTRKKNGLVAACSPDGNHT